MRIDTSGQEAVVPKSANQRRYVEAIREHDLVFGIGPAGTGKTYLAVAMAVGVAASEARAAASSWPARPSRPASGSVSFPATSRPRSIPYLRPLYDALYDMLDPDRADRLLEHGIVEVAPLAFMRGRTLNQSFVILDEAQNTTSEQMKMFLTRIGFDSKAVVTGDVTQIDLPANRTSGLVEVSEVIGGVTASPSSTSTRKTSCAIRWCSGSSWPTIATRRRAGSRAAEAGAPSRARRAVTVSTSARPASSADEGAAPDAPAELSLRRVLAASRCGPGLGADAAGAPPSSPSWCCCSASALRPGAPDAGRGRARTRGRRAPGGHPLDRPRGDRAAAPRSPR